MRRSLADEVVWEMVRLVPVVVAVDVASTATLINPNQSCCVFRSAASSVSMLPV